MLKKPRRVDNLATVVKPRSLLRLLIFIIILVTLMTAYALWPPTVKRQQQLSHWQRSSGSSLSHQQQPLLEPPLTQNKSSSHDSFYRSIDKGKGEFVQPEPRRKEQAAAVVTHQQSSVNGASVKLLSCATKVFPARSALEALEHFRYSPLALPPTLQQQMLQYQRRICERFAGVNSVLWAPYLQKQEEEMNTKKRSDSHQTTNIAAGECLTQTPECGFFLRDDFPYYYFEEGKAAVEKKAQEEKAEGEPTTLFRHENNVSKKLFATCPGAFRSHGSVGKENSSTTRGASSTHLKEKEKRKGKTLQAFLFRKCCIEHREMKQALTSLIQFSHSERVPVWITAGTLLGAAREGGWFIPWDTDVDVLIRAEDEKRFLLALQQYQQHQKSREDTTSTANEDGTQPSSDLPAPFYSKIEREVKNHAHGRMIALIYGTPFFRHEQASRVEVWSTVPSKKMQDPAINWPPVPCGGFQGIVGVLCPRYRAAVLERSYGQYWCTPCKHKQQNCKIYLEELFRKETEKKKV